MRWAALLQRVFAVDALCCPGCGSTMRLFAAIEDPTVARKILECLELPARAPPLVPAKAEVPDLGPDEADSLFDQSPLYDEPWFLASIHLHRYGARPTGEIAEKVHAAFP